MSGSVGIIGGADGPTAIFVSVPIGTTVLHLFAFLLLGLAVFALLTKLTRRPTPFAVAEALLVVFVDQHVKLLCGSMETGETRPLLPGLFRLELVHNYGAAWSSLSGERVLLIVVTVVGIGALIYLAARIVRHPLGVWALWMVIAGGIGNLIDRVSAGFVVDMIAAEFISFPVFNIADIFVTCGTVAAAVYYLKFYERYDAKNWEKQSDGADPSDNGSK